MAINLLLHSLNLIFGYLIALAYNKTRLSNRISSYSQRQKNFYEEIQGLYRSYGTRLLNKLKKAIKNPVLASTFLLIIICLSYLFKSFLNFLLLFAFLIFLIFLVKKINKSKLEDVFQKNAYRLYRYLVSQINAGVKPKEVITNMHKVTQDKKLEKVLVQASALYSVTLKGEDYAEVIKSNIKSLDAIRFCMILEEDLLYSDNENFLEKMEEMMFNRYFSYYQKKTDKVKRDCFLAVLVFMLIVMLMVALPLVNELSEGLKNIFL